MLSIINAPQEKQDLDYLAFSYNGKHSYKDFKIFRVSDGNNFSMEVLPQSQDKTAQSISGDGTFYFGTTYQSKKIPIKYAFEALTESELQSLKTWLGSDTMSDLWFEEKPYCVYSAKPTGENVIKYVPFEIDGNRVYRGEGTVNFIAYWPYGHTPDRIKNIIFQPNVQHFVEDWTSDQGQDIYIELLQEQVPSGGTIIINTSARQIVVDIPANISKEQWDTIRCFQILSDEDLTNIQINNLTIIDKNLEEKEAFYYIKLSDGTNIEALSDGHLKQSYSQFYCYPELLALNTLSETSKFCLGENFGQVPAPFIFTFNPQSSDINSYKITIGESYIIIENRPGISYTDVQWDSKTGLVSAIYSIDGIEKRRLIPFLGKSNTNIPVEGTNIIKIEKKIGDDWADFIKLEDTIWKQTDGTTWIDMNETPTLEYQYWYY